MRYRVDLLIKRPCTVDSIPDRGLGEYHVIFDGKAIGEAAYWARGWCFTGRGPKKKLPKDFYQTPHALRDALRANLEGVQ